MFDWLKTNKRLREELANVRALNDRLRGELGEHQDECDDLEAENERLRRKLAAVGAVAVRIAAAERVLGYRVPAHRRALIEEKLLANPNMSAVEAITRLDQPLSPCSAHALEKPE